LRGKGDRRMSEKKRIMQVGGVVTLATMIAMLATPAMAMTHDEALKDAAQKAAECKNGGGLAEVELTNFTESDFGWRDDVTCHPLSR
jgi:hypothetical protein